MNDTLLKQLVILTLVWSIGVISVTYGYRVLFVDPHVGVLASTTASVLPAR